MSIHKQLIHKQRMKEHVISPSYVVFRDNKSYFIKKLLINC